MEGARSDRKQQLHECGWQEGGFGLGGENQHPGAKITLEITLLRCLGGEKKRREVGKGKVEERCGSEGQDAGEPGCPDPPGDAGKVLACGE